MNFIFLSPHFPPNFYQFCVRLRQRGVNVFGLTDAPYHELRPELKEALTEYYWVNDMHDYDQLLRAGGYFTHRYGKIDRIDSHNEYWLETEARLRTDFNVFGLKTAEMDRIKRKSRMKQTFIKAGVEVARGQIVQTLSDGLAFIKEVGYPVIAKPDLGVGATNTYKINHQLELEQFFSQKPPVDYFMEEFVQGVICTFDGLTNHEGVPVFYTSHQYSQGIMEVVNNNDDVYYYSYRDIPADLEEAGRRTLKAFDVKERFFHFEFFRTPNNRLLALEVNMRPPGGLTLDMFNYANNFDIYGEWANVMVYNEFQAIYTRPYHCCHIGRKIHKHYQNSHEEVLTRYGGNIVYHNELPPLFRLAMGDYAYIVRSPSMSEILEMAKFIQQQK